MSNITMDEMRPLESGVDSVDVVQSGSWSVDANITNASLVVTATDLDIRDLAFATDSVTAHQGGSWSVDANITNASIVVTASDLDIRDLLYTQDSVTSHQGGTWTVGINDITIGGNSAVIEADGSLKVSGELEVDDVADDITVTKVAVDNTVGGTQLVATGMTNRREITIQNLGSQDMYINKNAATVDGIKVPKKSSATFKFSESVDLYAITASGSSDIRVIEAA